MHWIGFLRLLRTIYGPDPPDLDYIQKQGLLAVKIGQTYALRIDFLSEETCRHLGRLYRHVDAVSTADAEKIIDGYVTADWRENVPYIDPEPLASASVGQVHRARLANNDDVVVKFIKSDFRRTFVRDVKSLSAFVRFILLFYPKLARVADPLGILETIEKSTLGEIDLTNEVNGQQQLKAIYDKHRDTFDLSRLGFPKLYQKLSGRNVMVSELIDGRTFDEMLDSGEMTYDLLLELFHIHGFYIFCVGTFHGDIHPGNIIYKDGVIYFLDTGAIGTVSAGMRKGLFDFFDALSMYDYARCAVNLNRMAENGIAGDAFKHFKERFIDLYADYTDSTVSEVSLTKKMMQTIRLGVNCGMEFEKGMYPIIKSLMYLDGMVLRCNPDAVLVRDMRPFIDEFSTSMNASK